jgi:hypothetical protein
MARRTKAGNQAENCRVCGKRLSSRLSAHSHGLNPDQQSGEMRPVPCVNSDLEDFLTELTAFPGGSHDDQVDALVMGLNHLRHHPPSFVKLQSLQGDVYYDSRYASTGGKPPLVEPPGDLELGKPPPRVHSPNVCDNCRNLAAESGLRDLERDVDGATVTARVCVLCWHKLGGKKECDFLKA